MVYIRLLKNSGLVSVMSSCVSVFSVGLIIVSDIISRVIIV